MDEENKEQDSRLRGNDNLAEDDPSTMLKANKTKMPFYNKWYFWLIVFVVLAGSGFVLLTKDKDRQETNTVSEVQTQSSENAQSTEPEVQFTHRIFDPAKVSNITPLGEVNGGYVETQTINGVMINLKLDNNRNTEPIEVYAPTDMTLEDYSYFPDPFNPNRPTQWHLGFRISKNMKLSFDHISWVPDNIKEVTPPTQNSGYVPPTKKLFFKAGDLIAKTTGTDLAHNWNIYLRDNRKTNTFANQARYEKVKEMYDYVNAACPFDYYEESMKNSYIALMGYSKAGQSKTCGSNSKDMKGSISGMWHLNKEGVREDYQGQYASPFSVYKTSANEIILYEINKKRYIIGASNKTYKDPAEITDSHCYNLTEYGDEQSTKGYAYFRVDSDMEMSLAYSATGSCPAQFPGENSKKYYR